MSSNKTVFCFADENRGLKKFRDLKSALLLRLMLNFIITAYNSKVGT
jgi:hypothetical protein